MVDRLTVDRRAALMRAVKTKNTGPEMVVRWVLHRLGYRFRVHRRDLPGTPDIVLPGRKAAILVHGCFWHAHGCRIGQAPKSNLDYWAPKLAQNTERDARKANDLREAGWKVLVIWQCETADTGMLALRLIDFLEN